jgi:uncharacterized membrane protein
MLILDALFRIIHVGTAITLVGGSVFMLLVLIPSANEKLDDETHKSLGSTLIPRWKRIVHPGVLLFLVSGFYNYFRAIPLHKGDGLYHALIGTKMLLALGVFFLASALVGRSEKLEHFRANRAKWLKVLVLLAATIVTISGFAKVRGLPVGETSVDSIESSR